MEPADARPAIVAGIDDHDAARDAAALGIELAERLGADLALARAGARGTATARDEDADPFAIVADVVGGREHRRFELEEPPERALPELAERLGALAIVIGVTHRGRLGRLYPGALVDRLAGRTACPVAVAPHAYGEREHRGMGLVGVAFDGSAEARAALEAGRALAPALDAELEIITVAPVYEDDPDDPMLATREEVYRERQMGAVRSAAAQAEPVLDRGDPAAVLARHAVDLDLLIVGAHAHGKLLRTLLGSVGSDLARTAPCPVLIVPRGPERRPERGAT